MDDQAETREEQNRESPAARPTNEVQEAGSQETSPEGTLPRWAVGEIRGPYSPFLCGRLSTASQEGTGDKEAAHLEGGAAHIRGIVEETHQRSDPNYDGRAVTTTERQER